MSTRRDFLATAAKGAALVSAGVMIPGLSLATELVQTETEEREAPIPEPQPVGGLNGHYRPPQHYGMGGVALGNAFHATPEEQAEAAMRGAWEAGIRYFDTSPFYGHGLCERRFGAFLHTQKREAYTLSTKVGRVFKATTKPVKSPLWKAPSPFEYTYDYTADGVRRSIEDSLQRLGIESLDMVFIHDLSPDNRDFDGHWLDYFEIARKGAMPELTRMREEGLIKGWGLGVNEIAPILKALEVADPDVCLCATQYSLIKHAEALDTLFPACEENKVSIIVGAPLNAGFLAGVDRYDYAGTFPAGAKEKRAQLEAIVQRHGVDLRTAALHFSAAPKVVSAVIPGARSAEQARQNAESMQLKVPADLWKELKVEGLIAQNAPVGL